MTKTNEAQAKFAPSQRRGLSRYFPFLAWLSHYQGPDLNYDMLAGLFVAVLLIPQAMAYALLADLPPQVGLYASIGPALLYAVFGTSRFLSIGPVALVSLLVGDAISRIATSTDIAPPEAALALAIMVGLMLILMGLLRLGFLVNFISDPVLTGFTSAAAVLIATSQVRNLLGLEIPRSAFYKTIAQIGQQVDQINPVTALIGVTVLLILIGVNYFSGSVLDKIDLPDRRRILVIKGFPLVVVMVSAGLVWGLGLQQQAGVEVVGSLKQGLPPLTVPPFSRSLWVSLFSSGLAISVIVYVTATAVAKSLAGRRRQKIDPSQEAIALGTANIVSAFTGGYPVGASLSRSAINFDAKARSPVSSALSGLLVLVVILFFSSIFQYLPKATLAALVISAVIGLFSAKAMVEVWRYSRLQAVALFLTFFGVLFLGLEWGIAVGALSEVLFYLWRTSRPRLVVEGRLGDSQLFRSIDRDGVENETLPVLVLRIDQSLYFGNVSYSEERALELVADQQKAAHLVLDFKSVNDIDVSGFKMLNRLTVNLADAGVTLNLAQVKQPVLELLKNNGFLDELGQEHIFLTADEAVNLLAQKK